MRSSVTHVSLHLKNIQFGLEGSFANMLQDSVLRPRVSIPAEEIIPHLRLVRLIESPEDGSPIITHISNTLVMCSEEEICYSNIERQFPE